MAKYETEVHRLHLSQICKKTAEATGFSEHTVNHVPLEKRMLDEVPSHKRYTHVRKAENMQMLCWSQVEGDINEHNKKFTLSAVKDLTYEGFWRVGHEQWRKNISHVTYKVEDNYWIADDL